MVSSNQSIHLCDALEAGHLLKRLLDDVKFRRPDCDCLQSWICAFPHLHNCYIVDENPWNLRSSEHPQRMLVSNFCNLTIRHSFKSLPVLFELKRPILWSGPDSLTSLLSTRCDVLREAPSLFHCPFRFGPECRASGSSRAAAFGPDDTDWGPKVQGYQKDRNFSGPENVWNNYRWREVLLWLQFVSIQRLQRSWPLLHSRWMDTNCKSKIATETRCVPFALQPPWGAANVSVARRNPGSAWGWWRRQPCDSARPSWRRRWASSRSFTTIRRTSSRRIWMWPRRSARRSSLTGTLNNLGTSQCTLGAAQRYQGNGPLRPLGPVTRGSKWPIPLVPLCSESALASWKRSWLWGVPRLSKVPARISWQTSGVTLKSFWTKSSALCTMFARMSAKRSLTRPWRTSREWPMISGGGQCLLQRPAPTESYAKWRWRF